MTRIVLFDIDGTLLTMGNAAKVAFADALTRAAGQPIDPDGYSFSGKTDPQIARDILALHGVEGAKLEAAIPESIRLYVETITGDTKRLVDAHLLPGVTALLDALRGRSDARVALLTGNVEGGARVKVGHFDLTRYFDFSISCFGSDDADRYRLPALALQRARDLLEEEMTGGNLVVVGDSEHDILCARTVGARTVAVGTGWTTESRLRALRPDVFLENLSETGRAVEAILGPEPKEPLRESRDPPRKTRRGF